MGPALPITRYECPYQCGWHHDAAPAGSVRLEGGTIALDLDYSELESDLRAHLDADHPGWTMVGLVGLQRERHRQALTLAEAECLQQGGHSYDIVIHDRHGNPVRVVCGSCPVSWDIAGRTSGT